MTGDDRRSFLRTAGAGLGVAAGLPLLAACSSDSPTAEVSARSRDVLADLSSSRSGAQNSESIESAIADAVRAGAGVVIPGGSYDHTGFSLPADGGTVVRGAGRGVTRLRNIAQGSSVRAHGRAGGPYSPSWTLSNLTLDATTKDNTVGLDVLLSTRFTVRDIDVHNHRTGVLHKSSWACRYSDVSVWDSGTGWQFPATEFTPSAPVSLTNCNAFNNVLAVRIDDAIEGLLWEGGDWSGCGTGATVSGGEVRTVLLSGINFERIGKEDLIVGGSARGPVGLSLHACRFFRTERGAVSVRYRRGVGLNLTGCTWTNYATAIAQEKTAGSMTASANSTSSVANFVDHAGTMIADGPLVASAGVDTVQISLTGTSAFHSVSTAEGVQTKMVSGPGRVSVSDDDFTVRPAPGWTAVVENTDDGSLRHAVRGSHGWRVSLPYS